jgi:hypothetical protein
MGPNPEVLPRVKIKQMTETYADTVPRENLCTK